MHLINSNIWNCKYQNLKHKSERRQFGFINVWTFRFCMVLVLVIHKCKSKYNIMNL